MTAPANAAETVSRSAALLGDFSHEPELCLDRFARTAAQAQALSQLTGQGTVAGNLGTVVRALLDAAGPALSGLAMSRAASSQRTREAMEGGAPGFRVIEEAMTTYLAVERRLGREAEAVDPGTAALAIVGTTHHLLMTSWPGAPDPQLSVTRLVALLVDGPGPSVRPPDERRSS